MSADNWGICPKCAQGKMYPFDKHELREDYEIYIGADGNFYVSYSGYCYACKFKFNYKHEEQVKL